MKRILLCTILCLLIATHALAESSVWRLQKGDSILYLGGTCHLLRPTDYPLPPEFSQAYNASDLVVFETDLGKLNAPETQQQLMAKAMYDDGSTIEKHVSAKTYQLLKDYCETNGMPIELFQQFKPSVISVMLTTIELGKLGATQMGVDAFFYQEAAKDGKPVAGLETVEQQIRYVLEMGEGNEDAFIAYSLEDLKTLKQQYEGLVKAWRDGDVENLNELMNAELKTKNPKLYKELLTDRNENWLPLIEAYQKTAQKEFILVGVGHLVGPDGIIEALKKRGYDVEQL